MENTENIADIVKDDENVKNDDNKKGKHAILKHSSQLAEVPLQSFTAIEITFFMSLAYFCQNRKTTKVKIYFDEFRELTGYSRRGDNALVKMLQDMSYKFAQITLKENKKNGFKIIVPYIDFEVDTEERCFTVGVHPDFVSAINDLDGSGPGKYYTLADVISISRVKSTYSKSCLRMLFLYRHRGCWETSVDDFKYYLDIPASYRTSDVNKVIETVKKEIGEADIFDFFEITPRYNERKKSKGRKKTTGYVFSFTFNEDFKDAFGENRRKRKKEKSGEVECPVCGKPLIKIARKDGSGIYFYGHRFGWDEDAPCRYTISADKIEGEINRRKKKEGADSTGADVTAGELEKYYRAIREEEILNAAQRKDEIQENHPEIWVLYKKYERKRADFVNGLGNFVFSEEGRLQKKEAEEEVNKAADRFRGALETAGYDRDYMEPRYRCRECRDTGQRADGIFCKCREERVKEAAEWLKKKGK